jgi:glucose/arabinose dehydrogenase
MPREEAADEESVGMKRRRLLRIAGAFGLSGLSGCGGNGTGGTPTTTGTAPTAQSTTATPAGSATPTTSDTATATATEEPTLTPTEPPDPEDHERTVLSDRMNNLIDIAVAPDGRVFYITRGAQFQAASTGTAEIGVVEETADGSVTDEIALSFPVFTGMEDGALGIAVDPDFGENGWVYAYYSPTNEEVAETDAQLEYLEEATQNGDTMTGPPEESVGGAYNLLSRFTVIDGSIDRGAEVEILRVPVQRDMCCHTGGDIEFGPEGHLYLTTGDNTYMYAPTDPGTAPMDERADRAYFDAQRTSGDTSDLRGKVLRITPSEDGSYTAPDGNLKDAYEAEAGRSFDDEVFRPEIYLMGLRNPYQAEIDPDTGTLFWGGFAPNASEWNPDRGPPGFNEFNRATAPGNYGWPQFTGPYPYVDYNYATEESNGPFGAAGPLNDSPHSNGVLRLPAAEDPFIWYPYDWSAVGEAPDYVDRPDEIPSFPSFEGAGPISGPVFRYESAFAEEGLHAWYDGKLFIAEWVNDWIKTVSFEGSVADGEVAEIRPFMPDADFTSPIAVEIGPEGALYVAEYGGRYGTADSRISKITRV